MVALLDESLLEGFHAYVVTLQTARAFQRGTDEVGTVVGLAASRRKVVHHSLESVGISADELASVVGGSLVALTLGLGDGTTGSGRSGIASTRTTAHRAASANWTTSANRSASTASRSSPTTSGGTAATAGSGSSAARVTTATGLLLVGVAAHQLLKLLLELLQLLLQLLGQGLIARRLSLLQSPLSLLNLLLQLHDLNLLGVDLLTVHSTQGLHHSTDVAPVAHSTQHRLIGESSQITGTANPGNPWSDTHRSSHQGIDAPHRSKLVGA